VEHPELGRSFVYPGEAAIHNGSPWRISRRAPLIGEHNTEIFCNELRLSRRELSILAESRRDLMLRRIHMIQMPRLPCINEAHEWV
jgi:hypothetical protein